MNGRHFPFGAANNPLVQVLSLLVLGVVLVGAVIMGAFVLMAVLGLAVIGFVAFTVRSWWLRRRAPKSGGAEAGAQSIRYIEAEYEVVESDEDAERRRSRSRR